MVIATIMFVVFMERALRKIHIQYPRRQVGMKVYDGGSSHLPVKVNPAGVIPAIFASSLIACCRSQSAHSLATRPIPIMSWLIGKLSVLGSRLYLAFFVLMIVFFAYFYTFNVSFKPDDVADNLKNQNGFVPGVRPGKKDGRVSRVRGQPRARTEGLRIWRRCVLLPEILSAASSLYHSTLAARRF